MEHYKMRFLTLAALSVSLATGFMPLFTAPRRPTSLNGGGKGVATSKEGKVSTVERVKGLLNSSEMIFSIPASGLTVAQAQKLRLAVPETTTVKVVKNKLMARAVEDTSFDCLLGDPLLKGSNMWFFIEDDISGTMKSLKDYYKDTGKKETHAILGGILENNVYDPAGVDVIGNLPSKQELYAKIAGSIKAVPTKVARVIKAPSNKLARAIKLATEEDKSND